MPTNEDSFSQNAQLAGRKISDDLFWAESIMLVDPAVLHTNPMFIINLNSVNEALDNDGPIGIDIVSQPLSVDIRKRVASIVEYDGIDSQIDMFKEGLLNQIQDGLLAPTSYQRDLKSEIEKLSQIEYYKDIPIAFFRSLVLSHALILKSLQEVLSAPGIHQNSIFQAPAFYFNDMADDANIFLAKSFRKITQICQAHLQAHLIGTQADGSLPLLDGFFKKLSFQQDPFNDPSKFKISMQIGVEGRDVELTFRQWLYQIIPHNTEIKIGQEIFVISNSQNLPNWQRLLTLEERQLKKDLTLKNELFGIFNQWQGTRRELLTLLQGDFAANIELQRLYGRMMWIQNLLGYSHPDPQKQFWAKGKEQIPLFSVRDFYIRLLPILRNFDPSLPLNAFSVSDDVFSRFIDDKETNPDVIRIALAADAWLKRNVLGPDLTTSQQFLSVLQHMFVKYWNLINRGTLLNVMHKMDYNSNPNAEDRLDLPHTWTSLIQQYRPDMTEVEQNSLASAIDHMWEFCFDMVFTTSTLTTRTRLQISNLNSFLSVIVSRLRDTSLAAFIPDPIEGFRVETIDAYTPNELRKMAPLSLMFMPLMQAQLGDSIIGNTGKKFSIRYQHDGLILKEAVAKAQPDLLWVADTTRYPRLQNLREIFVEYIDKADEQTNTIENIFGQAISMRYAPEKTRSSGSGNLLMQLKLIMLCSDQNYPKYRPVQDADGIFNEAIINRLKGWQKGALRVPIIQKSAQTAFGGLYIYYGMADNSKLDGKNFIEFIRMVHPTDNGLGKISYDTVRAWLANYYATSPYRTQLESWAYLPQNEQYRHIVFEYLSVWDKWMKDALITDNNKRNYFKDEYFQNIQFEFGLLPDGRIRPGWVLHSEGAVGSPSRPSNKMEEFYQWFYSTPTLDDYSLPDAWAWTYAPPTEILEYIPPHNGKPGYYRVTKIKVEFATWLQAFLANR